MARDRSAPGQLARRAGRRIRRDAKVPRRAFKSHAAPPTLPYQAPGTGRDVRYVVVVRNPDEAIASMRPFLAAHSDAWFDLWQVPRDALVGPEIWRKYQRWPVYSKFFDNLGPIPHHMHQSNAQAALVGKHGLMKF